MRESTRATVRKGRRKRNWQSIATCALLVEFTVWRKWCGTAKHLERCMLEGGEESKGWRDGNKAGVKGCLYGKSTHMWVYIWNHLFLPREELSCVKMITSIFLGCNVPWAQKNAFSNSLHSLLYILFCCLCIAVYLSVHLRWMRR